MPEPSDRSRLSIVGSKRSARVIVERRNGSLIVEVSDTGPGVRATDRRGSGLVGIAERLSMCGGVLEHGDGEHGGFRLRATLPVP
jgi:signal transduction histidine kinase